MKKYKNWKYYLETLKITINSRWLSSINDKPIFGNFLIPKRDFLPNPDKNHHGIWIAEIPFQMLIRFTDENDLVWSQFAGSGVDKQVCDLLNRKCISTDLFPQKDYIIEEDSRYYINDEKFDMILSHPPYWDIVKYSNDKRDGSTQKTLQEFINWFYEIIKNSKIQLKDNGYFILCCGNIYKNSEEIELGELLKNMACFNGFTLKQHIIKDYGETKGKEARNYNLNYYRQLKGGLWKFLWR